MRNMLEIVFIVQRMGCFFHQDGYKRQKILKIAVKQPFGFFKDKIFIFI